MLSWCSCGVSELIGCRRRAEHCGGQCGGVSVPLRITDFHVQKPIKPLDTAETDLPDAVGVVFKDKRGVGRENVPVAPSQFTFKLTAGPAGVA